MDLFHKILKQEQKNMNAFPRYFFFFFFFWANAD